MEQVVPWARLVQRFIGQPVPLLQEIDPQHPLQPILITAQYRNIRARSGLPPSDTVARRRAASRTYRDSPKAGGQRSILQCFLVTADHLAGAGYFTGVRTRFRFEEKVSPKCELPQTSRPIPDRSCLRVGGSGR
jgi:hypothetical protein